MASPDLGDGQGDKFELLPAEDIGPEQMKAKSI